MRSVGDVFGRIGGGQLYPCGLVCLPVCLSLFGFLLWYFLSLWKWVKLARRWIEALRSLYSGGLSMAVIHSLVATVCVVRGGAWWVGVGGWDRETLVDAHTRPAHDLEMI